MNFEIRRLSPEDLDGVFALFTAEFDTLPLGTLNPKSYEAFAELLSSPHGGHVGVFDGPKLVGYALCQARPWSAEPDAFALRGLLSPGEPVGSVLGTLVDRDYRGYSLGARLIRARRKALLENEVHHATGMMLTDNFSSIIMYLRCGSLLCGFDFDDYGLLNFAHYSGDLADRLPVGPEVQATEMDEMRELFGQGYVCRRMTWDNTGDSPRPVYHMSADFAG